MKKLLLLSVLSLVATTSFAVKHPLEGGENPNAKRVRIQAPLKVEPIAVDNIKDICDYSDTRTLLALRLVNKEWSDLSTHELRERYMIPSFTILPVPAKSYFRDVSWGGTGTKVIGRYEGKDFLYNIHDQSTIEIDSILSDRTSSKIKTCWLSTDGTCVAGTLKSEPNQIPQFFYIQDVEAAKPLVTIIDTCVQDKINDIFTFEPRSKAFYGVQEDFIISRGAPQKYLFKWTLNEGFQTLDNSLINPLIDLGFENIYLVRMSPHSEDLINLTVYVNHIYISYLWTPQQGIKQISFPQDEEKFCQCEISNFTLDGKQAIGSFSSEDENYPNCGSISYGFIYDIMSQQMTLLPHLVFAMTATDEDDRHNRGNNANFISQNKKIISSKDEQIIWQKTNWGAYQVMPISSLLHNVNNFPVKGNSIAHIDNFSPTGANMILSLHDGTTAIAHIPFEGGFWLDNIPASLD